MRLHLVQLLAWICLPAACTAPLDRDKLAQLAAVPADLASAVPLLGPNDILRVGVYGHPELSSPNFGSVQGTRVDLEGNLPLPLVGPVRVQGKSMSEARADISAAFAAYVKEPRVELSVIEYGARRIYLYGEVQKPGAHVMDRPLTAYQALALGGGFTSRAWREEILLVRGTPDQPLVHFIQGERPDPSGMLALQPDDFLFVRRSGPGRFADEILPVLSGVSSSVGTLATLVLVSENLKK